MFLNRGFRMNQQILQLKADIEKKRQQNIANHNKKVKLQHYKEMNTDFNIKNEYNSIIPLNFYTCWHTKILPPKMKENYDLLVKLNPEFTCNLFDEDECREFIKNNFNKDILDAYNNLIPCSYKSDLWRFCVLYKNGGIYMDIKYKCVNNFKLIALTEKEYFVRDRPKHMTYTALIAVKPENPIMLKCIRKIVENVKKKYYGFCSLCPTGPGLLGSFFSLEEIKNMEIYFTDITLENNSNIQCMVYMNKVILKYYDGYRKEQAKYQKRKYYADLWRERNIYK